MRFRLGNVFLQFLYSFHAGVHATVSNLLNLGLRLVKAERYRNLRKGAFDAPVGLSFLGVDLIFAFRAGLEFSMKPHVLLRVFSNLTFQ